MIKDTVRKYKLIFSDFFFAPRANCLGCSSQLGSVKGFLCSDCYASLSPLYTTFEGQKYVCNLCGNEITGLRCKCGGRRNKAYLSYSAYYFDLPVSTLIKAFKYRSVTALAGWMADEMITALKGERNFDVITYVPMHILRKIHRGFNQSEILASLISDKLRIPVKPILVRKRFTRKQATLKGRKRRKNLINAFDIKDKDIKGKHILIIDDVRTTGTTIISCAKILMENGAEKVSALTLASGRLK